MQFGNPYFLSLLWIVPALIFFYIWAFKRKNKLIETFVSPELKGRLLKGVSPTRQKFKVCLIVAAGLFIILSLIRPKWGFQWKEVTRRGVDIMVALDVSESMMAQDVEPNRLERAKREIIDLLQIVEGDRIGLIAFAGTSFIQCPLTLDYGAVQIFLDYLDPDLIPVPGTAIEGAIDESIKAFDKTGRKSRALILITDGEDHTGKPLDAAKRAKAANIRVYAVGIGKDGGAPIPNRDGGGFKKKKNGELILTQLDEDTLQKVALETGGSYVRSISGDLDLEKIYEDIGKSLEEKELKSGRQKRFEERYQWPLLIAFILLFFEMITSERPKSKWLSPFRRAGSLVWLVGLLFSTSPVLASKAGEASDHYDKGEYQEALTKFLDAQIEDPQNIQLKYNLANTYYKLGRFEEAEKLFTSSALNGEKDLSQKSYYNLGNTAYKSGKLQEAINHYEKALELNPEDKEAKQNLAFVREEIKRRIEENKKRQQQQQQNQQGGEQKQDQKDQQNQQNQQAQQQQQQPQSGDQKEDPKQAQAGDKKDEEQKEEEEQQQAQAGQAREMTKEEAERYLSTLKEDRKKYMKKQLQGQRRYRVEKDW